MMRLYLDDLRAPPPGFDAVAHTAAEALAMLASGRVQFISLDHDLGTEATGNTVAAWIERAAFDGPVGWAVHGANPVLRVNFVMALTNADCCRAHRAADSSPEGTAP